MRDLTTTGTGEKNALESSWPFVFLFEAKTLDVPAKMYRLSNYTDQVVHRGNIYYPAPLKVGNITASGRGDLPSIDIALGNAKLEVSAIVEAGDGYIGQRAVVTLINLLEVATDDAGVRFDGEITALSMTGKTISFTLSARDLYRAKIPPFRYARRRCRFLLGSGGCGYSLIDEGSGGPAFTVCPGYTFEACTSVGLDEVARGLPIKHPERIGAYPGIARPRGGL